MGFYGIMEGHTKAPARRQPPGARSKEVRPLTIAKFTRLRRDWLQAIQKLEREAACRVFGGSEDLQAAHTIGRRCDPILQGPRGGEYRLVHPDAIVPLCGEHHRAYDARQLDLLPYMHLHEQTRAVEDAGGIVSALKRLGGPNG